MHFWLEIFALLHDFWILKFWEEHSLYNHYRMLLHLLSRLPLSGFNVLSMNQNIDLDWKVASVAFKDMSDMPVVEHIIYLLENYSRKWGKQLCRIQISNIKDVAL